MSKIKKKLSEDRLDRVERILAESAANFREIEKSLAATNKHLGGFTQSVGEALESEFIAALQESKRIGNIALDEVLPNLCGRHEYDAAGINGDSAVVVEIKHKVRLSDVQKFAEESLPHFAKEFSGIVGKRKIFGAVGGGSITKKAKEEAAARGLYVLRLRNRQLVVDSDRGVRAI